MDKLADYRQKEDLNLSEASNQAGVPVSDLSRWENHQRKITDPGTKKLASIYGFSPVHLKNVQHLHRSLQIYEELNSNEGSQSPSEWISSLWRAEKMLTECQPENSSLGSPHDDLSEEIEFWRQKLLWIIQDAKEAVREGDHLLPLDESTLEGSYELFRNLENFDRSRNGDEDYYYLDRAFTELIDELKDLRYVHISRHTIREKFSYGLQILRDDLPEVFDLIQNNEWDELLEHEVIVRSHDQALKVAVFLQNRAEDKDESNDQKSA